MRKTLVLAIAAIAVLLGAAACDTREVSKVAIQQRFPEQYDKALAVAECESGLDPSAVSPGGGNWGLFQINTVHQGLVSSLGYSWADITNPFVNAHVARVIYDQAGGWSPWSCG